MKNKITAMVCSLFLLIYPMFLAGILMDKLKHLDQGSVFALIGIGLVVAIGVFWNIWIQVSTHLEKEILEERLRVMTKKAAEVKQPPPVAPLQASSIGSRPGKSGRFESGRKIQGFRPS